MKNVNRRTFLEKSSKAALGVAATTAGLNLAQAADNFASPRTQSAPDKKNRTDISRNMHDEDPVEIDRQLNKLLEPLIKQTLKPAAGGLAHPYIVPGGYDQAWDWDSYFIAEALADRPEALPHIRGVVENFFSQKNREGRIPRWIHPTRSFWDTSCPGAEGFGRDLAKPFLAQTALVYCRVTDDYEWFRPYLGPEMEFLKTWRRERMGQDGLHVWANGLESGGDNHPDVYCWPDFTVEGVDLAVFLIREYLAAGKIAHKLNQHGTFQYFVSTARFLLHQLQDLLYDPETNTFHNRWRVNGHLIRIQTQTQFYPLYLGKFLDLDDECRRAMLSEHLLDPHRFWSHYGIRSISREDPHLQQLRRNRPIQLARARLDRQQSYPSHESHRQRYVGGSRETRYKCSVSSPE